MSRYPWEHLIDRAWERFIGKIAAFDPMGCWIYTGGTSCGQGNSAPYGSFWVGEGHTVRAHIFAAAAAGVYVLPGHHHDHLCKTTLCCNPLHFEGVTPRENSLRRWGKTDLLVPTGPLLMEWAA